METDDPRIRETLMDVFLATEFHIASFETLMRDAGDVEWCDLNTCVVCLSFDAQQTLRQSVSQVKIFEVAQIARLLQGPVRL